MLQADRSRGASAIAFSLTAPIYDAGQRGNKVARWSRRRSLNVLRRTFKRGERVIEIGCGTGDEAIYLAKRGIEVTATDAAEGMLGVLRGKREKLALDVRQRISIIEIPASKIGGLLPLYGSNSLDGAYSSFGPLNCEADLAPVVQSLATLVKPGGRVVLSFINRYCAWETIWYLATRQPRKAFRRWSGYTLATVHGDWQETRIPVYYWTPGQIRRAFSPDFCVTRQMALPWLFPPQYLNGLFAGRARLFRLLERVERLFAPTWPFYNLGDHFLVELVRQPIAEIQGSKFQV